MTETLDRPAVSPPLWSVSSTTARMMALAVVALVAAGLVLMVGIQYAQLSAEDEALTASTPYALLVWIADQSANPQSVSLLANIARQRAAAQGLTALPVADAVAVAQTGTLIVSVITALLAATAAVGLLGRARWVRRVLVLALIGLLALLLALPMVAGSGLPGWILLAMGLIVSVWVLAGGHTSSVLGLVIAISVLMMVWESAKALADSAGLALQLPQAAWQVSEYESLPTALAALQAGDVQAVFADENDLETLMPVVGARTVMTDPTYPDLRGLSLASTEQQLIFPLNPNLPGRLAVAVRSADAAGLERPSQLADRPVGAVTGEFAATRFLNQPRSLVLLDMKILNDLNLPHLQAIAKALLQPARRNGEVLLVRILGSAGLYTWGEAVFGFLFGALLGLILGILFAHSRLMERAFLPYVVASQTVPILAIAPMVVIWLGASPVSVAVIAVYITFFPVTINTLRGLTSPSPTSIELMESYAASRWDILWKLRFPSALPYIFTALKVSATASVVGAIIGELPSGIGEGLGRAILDFSSDYSAISTPKLWAAIVIAALVGVTFFLMVTAAERVVLRRYIRSAD